MMMTVSRYACQHQLSTTDRPQMEHAAEGQYEYQAPRFYDFAAGENADDIANADTWFGASIFMTAFSSCACV